jgi:hypothetical protein
MVGAVTGFWGGPKTGYSLDASELPPDEVDLVPFGAQYECGPAKAPETGGLDGWSFMRTGLRNEALIVYNCR